MEDDERGSVLNDLLHEVMLRQLDVRDAFARRLGVSTNELAAIEHLMMAEMGPVELSRRLDLTSAAATLLLHRLEESGHVHRQPHPTDGRRQIVAPTPSGAAAVYGQVMPMVEGLDAVARSLTPAEQEVVASYLTRVVEVLKHTAEQA
jgi:DNA-binding MarR family transcriptional regulator